MVLLLIVLQKPANAHFIVAIVIPLKSMELFMEVSTASSSLNSFVVRILIMWTTSEKRLMDTSLLTLARVTSL